MRTAQQEFVNIKVENDCYSQLRSSPVVLCSEIILEKKLSSWKLYLVLGTQQKGKLFIVVVVRGVVNLL